MGAIIRAGGKYTSSHTTCTEASAQIADIANALPEVNKIALGYLHNGVKSGDRRLKIQRDGNVLLLKVQGSKCVHDIRIFTCNIEKTKGDIARKAKKEDFEVVLA